MYRPCVGIALFNSMGQIFLGQRIDLRYLQKSWQMPQGGIEVNTETPEMAAVRELEEETGIMPCYVHLVSKYPDLLYYDFPDNCCGSFSSTRKYQGQQQQWFLYAFGGSDKSININTTQPEFYDWKWSDSEEILSLVVDFKIKVYQEVIEYFSPLIRDFCQTGISR